MVQSDMKPKFDQNFNTGFPRSSSKKTALKTRYDSQSTTSFVTREQYEGWRFLLKG
jgi:hypothetical protein